jgi:hypothetical protein
MRTGAKTARGSKQNNIFIQHGANGITTPVLATAPTLTVTRVRDGGLSTPKLSAAIAACLITKFEWRTTQLTQ